MHLKQNVMLMYAWWNLSHFSSCVTADSGPSGPKHVRDTLKRVGCFFPITDTFILYFVLNIVLVFVASRFGFRTFVTTDFNIIFRPFVSGCKESGWENIAGKSAPPTLRSINLCLRWARFNVVLLYGTGSSFNHLLYLMFLEHSVLFWCFFDRAS